MISDRRSILAGLAMIATTPVAMAQAQKQTPAELTAAPMNFAEVKTAPDYFVRVLGPAEVSLSTSQIAIEKATQRNANEFAGFEFGEAIAVNMVLKDLGTQSPAMNSKAMATVERMKSSAKGAAFDRAYIAFQLDNHEYLRDLADAYLHNSAGASDAMEKQGRLLASLMLAVFTEHVAICKRVNAELKA